MSDKCNTCPAQAGCEVDSEQCETQSLMGSLNNIRNVIAIMSGKGGVGKSSVTALLASAFTRFGYKVGVLDADITGPSQPKIFGLDKNVSLKMTDYGIIAPQNSVGIKVMSINFFLPNNDDPVLWRGPMLTGAVSQFRNDVDWRDLDYLFVDLPPGTGDVPISVMQTMGVKGIVIVSSPQDLAVMVVKKTIKMARKMGIKILGLVENMSYLKCSNCQEKLEIFGSSQGEQVAKDNEIAFLGSLPWDVELTKIIDAGKIETYRAEEVDNIVKMIIADLP